MENMLDLLDEEPEVKDELGAPELLAATGKIEFRDVTFSYSPERTILKNLSFTAMPGQTVAFVSTEKTFHTACRPARPHNLFITRHYYR